MSQLISYPFFESITLNSNEYIDKLFSSERINREYLFNSIIFVHNKFYYSDLLISWFEKYIPQDIKIKPYKTHLITLNTIKNQIVKSDINNKFYIIDSTNEKDDLQVFVRLFAKRITNNTGIIIRASIEDFKLSVLSCFNLFFFFQVIRGR